MSHPEFHIPLHDIDSGGKQFVFPIRAAWLRSVLEDVNGAAPSGDGDLDIRVSKSGNDVVVHGSLRAQITVPCARCLEPAHVKIDEPISALFVPRSQLRESGGEDEEQSLEDADVLPYDGDSVNLDELVRDELVLEIPMIPLCSEQCPGISPPSQEAQEAKADAAADPRLAPLLQFRRAPQTPKG